MLNFLNIDLAGRNPAAYTAHFTRLRAEERSSYLATLPAEALAAHLKALGAKLTLGFMLRVSAGEPALAAVVAGKALTPASGWQQAGEAELAARAFAEQVGAPVVVTGLLELDLKELACVDALTALGWQVEAVSLCLDAEHQRLEWNLTGTLVRGGTFWSAQRGAPLADAGRAQQALEQAAERTGARFELMAL